MARKVILAATSKLSGVIKILFPITVLFKTCSNLISNLVLWYCEKLINGVLRIFLAMLCWLLAFTLFWDQNWGNLQGPNRILESFKVVSAAFFEYSINTNSWSTAAFTTFVVLVAIIHVGLIVSYLFSLIARK